ncbi:TRAP transporter small permease [candidate division KSB1 bacterium]
MNTIISLLKTIDNLFERIEKIFLVLVLLSVIGLSFFQVILRNYFSGGIFWADIFLRNMVLWLGLIGASLATKRERHIGIDIVSRIVKSRGKYAVNIIISFVSMVVCLILFNASLVFIESEKSFGSEIFDGFPSWIVQMVFPVAFGLMIFRFGLHVIYNIREIVKKSSED